MSITGWNQLHEVAIGPPHGKTHIFKTRVREVETSGGEVKGSEVKGSEM